MDKLKDCQIDIVKECLAKKSGGLSLAMGFGKTIICTKKQKKYYGFLNLEL